MPNRVFFPFMSLFGRPLFGATLKQIRQAGFDGVECHLIGDLLRRDNIVRVQEEAHGLGLDVHFHQGWSWKSGQRIWQNMVLRPLGALVPANQSYADQVKFVGDAPVVMYGNVAEVARQQNFLYQTASEFCDGKSYASSIEAFTSEVVFRGLPVVFDTQHVLEWKHNASTVEGLPRDPRVLSSELSALWRLFRPYTREIHLCDFNPRLGKSTGRNVFPGTGILPIEEFAREVRDSGWSGIITPEVAPQHISRKTSLLETLQKKVRQLF